MPIQEMSFHVIFHIKTLTTNRTDKRLHVAFHCLHDSYITKFDFVNYAFAKLVVAWL